MCWGFVYKSLCIKWKHSLQVSFFFSLCFLMNSIVSAMDTHAMPVVMAGTNIPFAIRMLTVAAPVNNNFP